MPLTPVFDPTTGASGGAVAGGGSTTPVWLTAPTTQAYLPQTGSSLITLTWSAPTNGVGPYTYTAVDLIEATGGMAYWEYDLATRTISVAPTSGGSGTTTDRPFVWRIEVTDSVGNQGRIWVIGWYSGSAAQYTYFLNPIVVGPNDTFSPYTFPSATGTSVGVNLQTSWRSTGSGNGWVTPTVELMVAGTPNRRYQGPFTVDVPAGEIFCLCTTQQEGTSSAYYIRVCQPFIRLHDPSKTYWESRTISDLDFRVIGAANAQTFAGPYTTTINTLGAVWNPSVGTTDQITLQANASPAGSGSTNTTELMGLNASNGLYNTITNNVAVANSRALRTQAFHVLRQVDGFAGTFTQNPSRWQNVCGTAEMIVRMRLRFDMSGGIGSTTPNVIFSTSTDGTYSTVGAVAISFERYNSALPPWAAGAAGRLKLFCQTNFCYLPAFEMAAWASQELGVDFYITTEQVTCVVYRWADAGSTWPDIDLPDPYAGYDTMFGRLSTPLRDTNQAITTSIPYGTWGIFGYSVTVQDGCGMYTYLGSSAAVSSAAGSIYNLRTMTRSRRIVPA